MDEITYSNWLVQLRSMTRDARHRCVIILSGSFDWCRQQASLAIDSLALESCLQVSSAIDHALSPGKARSQLGNEVDAVIFDAHHELDPDALGAVSGTIRGGGFLLLIMPAIQQWRNSQSRFYQRLLLHSQQQPGVYLLTQDRQNLPRLEQWPVVSVEKQTATAPFKTSDQQRVVEAITANALRTKPLPVVLTSDRGRGKSSALGLAAAMLLEQGMKNIVVSAPRLATSEPLFRHAQQVLQVTQTARGELSTASGTIRFIAPDALLAEKPLADLVMIDEAAAIPLSMLSRLLHQYPAIVFSSTIHGYEGTGRGFALKFNKLLDETNPGWVSLEMQTPVRWAEHDPLEQWLDKLLCLDADVNTLELDAIPPLNECQVTLLDRQQLLQDERRLSGLFALLVFAHYRTQPSDLKHLLDDRDVRVYSLTYHQQLLGVLLVNQEGGFEPALSSAVYRGERRPPGHLLAQTLTFHAGCESAAMLHYARVMRIVIHPQCQGHGLGSYFLEKVCELEQQNGMDAIGTSFAASAELMRFWNRSGFNMVRMGFTRDHVSGLHSAVFLKPVSEQGEQVFTDSRQRFQANLADWLAELLVDLDCEIKALLLNEQQGDSDELTANDWQDIDSFTATHRGYEACIRPVRKLVEIHPELSSELSMDEQCLLEQRLRQRKDWQATVAACGYTGKAQAIRAMKQAVGKMLKKIKTQ